MDFRTATDTLFRAVPHAELAERLGYSVATIRQARLRPDASGHRSPPPGWQKAVRDLAKERGAEILSLAEALDTP